MCAALTRYVYVTLNGCDDSIHHGTALISSQDLILCNHSQLKICFLLCGCKRSESKKAAGSHNTSIEFETIKRHIKPITMKMGNYYQPCG